MVQNINGTPHNYQQYLNSKVSQIHKDKNKPLPNTIFFAFISVSIRNLNCQIHKYIGTK